MRVEKQGFVPVVITLESQEELDAMAMALSESTATYFTEEVYEGLVQNGAEI